MTASAARWRNSLTLIAGIFICLTTGCIKDPLSSPVDKKEPESGILMDASFEKPEVHANCQAVNERVFRILTATIFFMVIIAIPLNSDRAQMIECRQHMKFDP